MEHTEHAHIPCLAWGQPAELVCFKGRSQGQDWYVVDLLSGTPRERYTVAPDEAITELPELQP